VLIWTGGWSRVIAKDKLMVQRALPIRTAVRSSGLAALVVLGLAEPAGATGFFVNQQSVKGLGRVGAGSAAAGDDLGTIFFNPAGLTAIWTDAGDSRTQISFGAHLIIPRSDLHNRGSTASTLGTLGTVVPYFGSDGSNPTDPTPVPNLYWAHRLTQEAVIGFGVNFPFGLDAAYNGNWFGRYDAIEASLRTINLSVVGAYKFGSGISVGGGLDFQYASTELVSAIPNPLTPGGPIPATDGRAQTTGKDWTPGFNLGILVPLSDDTRVGLHYRSAMKHTVDGSTLVTGLTGPLALFNGRVGASARLDLPAMASLGLTHQVSKDLQLLAGIDWYDWSRFREVRIKFANGSPDVVRPANYRDAFAFALGAEYRASSKLTTRAGIRFDRTPTVNGYRDSTVPDSNRLWLGIGATYRTSERSWWDFAFNHVFFRSTEITPVRGFFEGSPAASTIGINGRVKSVVNTLSVGYRHAF
jgi:long-chain fatty acid transport protein